MADNGVKKKNEKSDQQLLKIVLITIEFTALLQYSTVPVLVRGYTLANGIIERGFTYARRKSLRANLKKVSKKESKKPLVSVDHAIHHDAPSTTTQQSNSAKPPQPRILINIYYWITLKLRTERFKYGR